MTKTPFRGSATGGITKASEGKDGAHGASPEKRVRELFHTLFQAHPWHGVPTSGGAPYIFNAFIEIVPTDTVKYELDKNTGHLRLDRPQRYSSLCPTAYGFIPQTYCGPSVAARCAERARLSRIEGDGDPLDVCVLTEGGIAHGNVFAHVRPIGGLRMIDGKQADDKIVAVLQSDLAYGNVKSISDCPGPVIERLRHYFLTYKQRPDETQRKVQIVETYDAAEALEVVARSVADYTEKFGNPERRLGELRKLLRLT